MKKTVVTFLSCLLLTIGISAKVWTPESIPVAHLADRERYVCNPEGILSQDATDRIDAMMRNVEDSTGIQALIAVVSEIEPNDCFEFAHQLGEKNGVGTSTSDNGLVILLCTSERCIQFATGYGVEGLLPDALCRRIQEQYMNPHFRNDDWDKGMTEGAMAVERVLLDPENAIGSQYDDSSQDDAGILTLVLLFLGCPSLVAWLTWRSKHRCPNCRKTKLERKNRVFMYRKNGIRYYSSFYECSNCHHQLTRTEQEYENNGSNSGGMPGGMVGGIGGGSGHIGGHYGGGHFGGGGAGSRF
ncbi:MAG: TPM domain-containing protein [Bacteroidaceae bacterium]|nr:TPM domain-containing protein [Bacteroidaceae bacterium]